MTSSVTSGVLAASVAAALIIIGAVSAAEAGHGGHMGESGSLHVGGNMGRMHAYSGGNIGKLHTNPGGKYAYRGNNGTGYTNKGGKYAWSGKYDHDHNNYYNHHRYGRFPWWYGLPLYSYGYGTGGCGWVYRQAVTTGSDYWWNRYYQCTGYY